MTVSINSRPSGFVSGSSTPSFAARVRRVVQYRRILKLLVSRDLKVRYAGSALGYVWTVLDPLLMSVVYWFVFEKIFHRNAGPKFTPYMIYLVSGQLAWTWFSAGVSGITRALRNEAQMVRSSNVPRELWVLRVVASKGVEYLFGLPVLAVFALAYMTAPSKYVVLLPLGWLMEAVLLIGLGLLLAPVTVLFNDMERIVPIVMRVMFYISPILYSVDQVPPVIRSAMAFNPAVGFLTITHAAFFPAALHETQVKIVNGHAVVEHISHWDWVYLSAITTLVLFVIGVFTFVKLERAVLKEI